MISPVDSPCFEAFGRSTALAADPRFRGRNRTGGDEHPAGAGLHQLSPACPLSPDSTRCLLPLLAFATFGSSRYLVVAADSATAAILAGGISGMAPPASAKYVALAGMVALLTAGFLLVARLLKLGFIADFLSQTVLVGFLTGVGFQVGIAVLGEMLGLEVHSRRTVVQLAQVLRDLPHVHLPSLALSAAGGGGRADSRTAWRPEFPVR